MLLHVAAVLLERREADVVDDVLLQRNRQLTTDQQRLFRLLGLHPGRDVSTYSAAALAGLREPDAARLLDALVDAQLLQQGAADRYRFHDLLRAFAAERATEEDAETARRDAVTRLLDWYLYVGNTSKGLLSPHSRRLSLDEPRTAGTSMPGSSRTC